MRGAAHRDRRGGRAHLHAAATAHAGHVVAGSGTHTGVPAHRRPAVSHGAARRGSRGEKAHLHAAAALLALCLAAAAGVPAHSQEPAPAAAVPAQSQEPAAAPAPAPPEFEQILVAGEYRYARSRRAGVHVSFDRGHTWQPRGNGLPHRVVYPFPDPPEYAAVTSLAADPSDPRRLAATTATGVYLTTDGGMAWRQVATGQMHPHAYFTAVALSPHDPAGMLVGTSFHGIYETADGGATWRHLTPAIRFLADRSLFYEEVAALTYDPARPSAMAVLAGFDGGVFYVADRFAEQREFPGTGLLRFPVPAMDTIQLGFAAAADGWELHAGTVDARWRLAAGGTWAPIAGAEALRRGVPLQPPEPAKPPADAGSQVGATDDAGRSGQPPAATEASADAGSSDAGSPDAARAAADPSGQPQAGAEAPAAGAGATDSEAPTPPPPPGADAPADATPATATGAPANGVRETAAEAPAPPAAEGRQLTAPDSDAAGAAAVAAGAPERPQPEAVSARPAPDPADQAPRTTAGTLHTAVTAVAVAAAPADPADPADPAAEGDRDAVAGVADGLPRVPPPGRSAPEHANADNERSAGRQSPPAADRQPAAPLAAADPSGGQQATPAPATAERRAADRHGDGVAAAPATGTAAEAYADEHVLAAGEPGWIAGPEGTGPAAPRARAALRNGIYVRADRAAEALPEYLDLLVRHGLDSVVIDFKDDFGRLGYDSELPLARAMGAAPGPIRLDRLIADAHAAGIYVIARLVVFKDPVLYDWDNHRQAIWDREQDGPWRHLVPAGDDSGELVQREHWVDPFAPHVWQYNIDVAAELAARGVDEIQFDYIRFPSDGPTERALYRYRRPGMRRIDAIESFLAAARERLDVPISTDLFGFNSWYRAGNFIGQDIGVLADYADVISPMFYPSHFPNHFLADRGYLERAHDIYESGVRRAQRMVRGRAHIRPYVQAFLIGRELRMEEPEYSRYLTRQLDGNRAAAGSGFTLWNASNRYYMVTEPLQPYFDSRGEETP